VDLSEYYKLPNVYYITPQRQRRRKARGGSAVIIKEPMKHREHEKYSENHIVQAISVIVNNGIKNLVVTADRGVMK